MKKTGFLIAIIFLVFSFVSAGAAEKYPAGKDCLEDFLTGVRVLRPVSYKNLTIYPVVSLKERAVFKELELITLDTAAEKGWLKIGEVGSGSVPEVEVENTSSKFVFLMAGELLAGCKQDRMVARDIILPPESKIRIPVFCCEHGRWTAKSEKFEYAKNIANLTLRELNVKEKGQSEIWGQISKDQSRLGVSTSTGSLNETFASRKVKEMGSSYFDYFINLSGMHDMLGVVVAINGRISCADLFYRSDFFQSFWPKLLKSYVLDATGRENYEKTASGLEEARAFLKDALRAKIEERTNPGSGSSFKIESYAVSGGFLLFKGEVIHFDLFPEKSYSESENSGSPLLEPSKRKNL